MMKSRRKQPFDAFYMRLIQYFLGFIVLPLGVVSVLSTGLGAGPWDTTSYNLSQFLDTTLGTSSAIVNGTVMGIVIIYRRKWRFIFMLVPILGISVFLDFWDLLVFSHFDLTALNMIFRLLIFVVGTFVITFGLSLIILSDFPAGVFDELMVMFMDIFKTKSVFYTRLGVELLAIVLAILFGFLANIGLGAVNYGSVLLAILLAPILSWQMRWIGAFIYERP